MPALISFNATTFYLIPPQKCIHLLTLTLKLIWFSSFLYNYCKAQNAPNSLHTNVLCFKSFVIFPF